ncbi:alpha/beta-hydrolase [Coprinopsis marcescibilis]|uniref:triacylglycerol lipase n=1 Tax=Coprinopsis marcescibilis TaxID=230819 RepID=A0A5C3KJT1_COPMA|nr:alpha/beta-hydrolase [Coprinopsis marcescibilis]
MLLGLPSTLLSIITGFLSSSSPTATTSPSLTPLTFHLRHQHAVTSDSRIIFSDVSQLSSFGPETTYTIPRKKVVVQKPSLYANFSDARDLRRSQLEGALDVDWWEDEVPGPALGERDALLQFANMAFDAYYPDNTTEWYDVGGDGWNTSTPWGWLPGEDGMRGHVFVSSDNSTVVIAIKGTSAGWLVGGGGPTTGKDKLNDNLLFSCCCARVGPTWSTVCPCYKGGNKCDRNCVENALVEKEDLFYPVGLNLYTNVSYMYPDANIWVTGHSLGGSLSSLIGVTFGVPVVAFEAPAEKLAANRLHLPTPPSTQHITHMYHTADPIAMGACNGVTSSCAIGGFAMETRCHLGQVIRFDTVNRLGWSVDVRTHGIKFVIDKLLGPESEWKEEEKVPEEGGGLWSLFPGWGKKKPEGDRDERNSTKRTRQIPMPKPAFEVEGVDGVCTDCFSWEYGDFDDPATKGTFGCPQ